MITGCRSNRPNRVSITVDVEGGGASCLLPATESERIMSKLLLRVEEAAEVLAVSRWTIYRWVEQGRLEGTKIGRGSLRVFKSSLDRLIECNRNDMCKSVG